MCLYDVHTDKIVKLRAENKKLKAENEKLEELMERWVRMIDPETDPDGFIRTLH